MDRAAVYFHAAGLNSIQPVISLYAIKVKIGAVIGARNHADLSGKGETGGTSDFTMHHGVLLSQPSG